MLHTRQQIYISLPPPPSLRFAGCCCSRVFLLPLIRVAVFFFFFSSLLKQGTESAGAEDAGIAAGWQSGLIMEPTPIARAMRQTAVAPARPCLCERITNSIAPPSLCECVAKSVRARRKRRNSSQMPPFFASPHLYFQLMHVKETCKTAGMECVFNTARMYTRVRVRLWVCGRWGSSNILPL